MKIVPTARYLIHGQITLRCSVLGTSWSAGTHLLLSYSECEIIWDSSPGEISYVLLAMELNVCTDFLGNAIQDNMEETMAGGEGFFLYTQEQCLLTSENKSSELPHPAVSLANSQYLPSFLKSQIHLFHYSVRMVGSGLVSEPRKRSVSSSGKGEHLHFSFTLEKNWKVKNNPMCVCIYIFILLKTNSHFLRQRTVNI